MSWNWRFLFPVVMVTLVLGHSSIAGTETISAPNENVIDFLTHSFISELSDRKTIYESMNVTPQHFNTTIKSELTGLVSSSEKTYRLYVTDDMSEEQQEAIIKEFLNNFATRPDSINYLSSYFIWNLFYTKKYELINSSFEDWEKTHPIKPVKLVAIRNFCMNALTFMKKQPDIPGMLSKTQVWLPGDLWDQLLWHNAYHISSMMDNEKKGWCWIESSILILQDAIKNTQRDSAKLCEILSVIYNNRLDDDNDKYNWYYNLQIATQSETLLKALDSNLINTIKVNYPGIDWRSPTSFGIYWCEYAISHLDEGANTSKLKLERILSQCLSNSCKKGCVEIIEGQQKTKFTLSTPNFNMMEILLNQCLIWLETAEPRLENIIRRSIKHTTNSFLSDCYRFGRYAEGQKLYSNFSRFILTDRPSNLSFSEYMAVLIRTELPENDFHSFSETISNNLEDGYVLIAIGRTKDGSSLLHFADLIFKEAKYRNIYQDHNLNLLKEKAFFDVSQVMPQECVMRLNKWKTENSPSQ